MSDDAWTIDDHLRGKPAASIALYDAFVELVAACGPYTVSVSKSSITFKGTRRGFAGARPDARGLKGYLDLQRQVEDARISSAAPYESRLFVHYFRVAEPAELDETFAGWVGEAYAVGRGDHVLRPR
jgi:hypothetical protein